MRKPPTEHSVRMGRLVRSLRKSRGLTQGDLAQLIGLSRTAVVNIEQGKQGLLTETLYRIITSLDYDVKLNIKLRAPTGLLFHQ